MNAAHQSLAWITLAATAGVLIAAAWSAWTGRRSGGGMDHRFAVDRLVLGALGAVVVSALAGLVIMATSGPPADPLHLLYGVLAVVALPLGRMLGDRAPAASVTPSRLRRDTWIGVSAAILLAIELRLFLTG